MVLSLDESEKRHANYIASMKRLLQDLMSYGYEVEVEKEIGLEATYKIKLNSRAVAELWWNVPYYMDFKALVEQNKKSFSEDYIKNVNDWNEIVDEVRKSLMLYAQSNA